MDPVDLLLPETDGGVLAQAILFLLLAGFGFWASRNDRDWRLVVIGVSLLGVGLIGFRALH